MNFNAPGFVPSGALGLRLFASGASVVCSRYVPVRRPRAAAGVVVASSEGPSEQKPVENVVLIGSGPAGYTAAIYAARANLKPLLLEGVRSGIAGGQLMTTADVDNFPGFPEGISGPDLMRAMRSQAVNSGAELEPDDAIAVDFSQRPFTVETASRGKLRAHSVIVATGASARRLGVPGEETFWSRGISACAICDGAAPIFAGQELAVVGGGDSACEEAVYLTKYGTRVHLLVRGGALRASKVLQDRVEQHPNVSVHFHTTVVEPLGAKMSGGVDTSQRGSPLRGVRVKNSDTGKETDLLVRGMFYAIGHEPNTTFLRKSGLEFDSTGYLVTTGGSTTTKIPGVFAAGDVADSIWRQAVTAAGTGCMAALAAERFLTENALGVEYKHDESASTRPGAASVESRESEKEQRTASRGADNETNYNLDDTWHKGQFALRKLYHESPRPVIVKYVSPNCGPCAQLKPMLHSVVRSMEDEVHFVEIDITEDADVAESAGVMGSPTVQIFFEKGLVKELKGVRMKSEYRRVIEDCLAQRSDREMSPLGRRNV